MHKEAERAGYRYGNGCVAEKSLFLRCKVDGYRYFGRANQICAKVVCRERYQLLCLRNRNLNFPENSFDVITACQCFWYFNHEKVMPNLYRMLKPDGKLLVLYMAWLPYEDEIAGKSEELVLKYSPEWSGAGEKLHPIHIPDCYKLKFDIIEREEYLLDVHFTRETWHGRMKACRGVGASLTQEEIGKWEEEHLKMLSECTPEEFDVRHYAALAELQAKK